MNRRSYLSGVGLTATAGVAGCLTRIGGRDDIDGPTLDAAEHMLGVGDLNTDWLYAPEDGSGYDFGFTNPNAIEAMQQRFMGIGADLYLAGSRHFLFWESVELAEIDQLTFVDRREFDEGYEAGLLIAEGDLDHDAIIADVTSPDFRFELPVAERWTHGGFEVVLMETGDVVAVDEGVLMLSFEPFRRGKERLELVERVIDARRGERERYFDANGDLGEVHGQFDEAHIVETGTGDRLQQAPEGALVTGEALSIEGAFAEVTLVALFETDADAQHATQFDPAFEELGEEAVITDMQVRGRMTITTQRVDTDVLSPDDASFEPDPVPDPGLG